MLLFVVSIKDRAAEVFNRPAFVPHRNVAVRDFTDEVNRVASSVKSRTAKLSLRIS